MHRGFVRRARLVGRWAALALVAGACRESTGGGGSRMIGVVAHSGRQPEPGVTVISHTSDGDVIDTVYADAVGRASVGVDDGALVSIVFPGALSEITPVVSVVTTLAPPEGVVLGIHGPDRGPPALVVGVLEISGANLPGADYFAVDVGCATVVVTQLPEYIDIGACSMGSDQDLDVLVRAYHDVGGDPPVPVFDGYAAGRARMANGRAVLDLPPWQTTGTPVATAYDGVQPTLSWTLYADGVPFASEPIGDTPFAYDNLTIDAAHIEAVIVSAPGTGRVTNRYLAGVPQTIALTDSDFLSAFDLSTEITGTSPLAARWRPAPDTIDAIHLHATWRGVRAGVVPLDHRVIWDVVLPPSATTASLPRLDDDLGATLAGAASLSPVDVLFRHIDSEELSDFDALQASGLHAEDTVQASSIVPRPASGQVRISHAIGVR